MSPILLSGVPCSGMMWARVPNLLFM
jgi:hypothetical protein